MKLISSCLVLLLLCSANAGHAQQALIAPEKAAATLAAPNVASIISSNAVVAVQVRTSNDTIGGGQIRYKGLFNIGTADGKSLLFQYPQEPITSHFNVRIDGVVYSNDPFRTGAATLPLLADPVKLPDGTITCTYQVGRIAIEQRLTPQQYTATTGAIFIQYLITNNDAAAHQVGLLLEMDTFIINNDAAPISTSFGYSRREQQFTAPFIPDYFQAFERNDLTQPGVVAQGTLIGRDAVRPDLVFVGDWANLSRVPWDYVLPNQFYNDSAVILRWNERRLAPGERRVVATYFGRGDVSFSGGTLALNLTAPHRLEAISGQLTPNPFEVNLVVTNAGFVPATSVQATLNLPQGLALVSGEFASKLVNPSDLNSQQSGAASWKVLAQCPVLDDTLTFNVTVTATNPLNNSVSRAIIIPSCAASLPNFTLTASPSSRSVIAGDLTTYNVSMQASGGFTGDAGLSLFPSTPGVTSTFLPSSINATTPSTLTLQTTRMLTPGTYNFVINGEGGGLTRSDTVALVVQAPPPEDKTPPFTINHNPARGARNVPLSTDIVVEVDDAQFGVDRNSLSMNVVGVTGVTEITEIRSAPKAYRLRFQPAVPFRDNQRVEVRINAADMAAPPNVMPTDIYTFTTVRDSLPPFTLDHFPARGATQVPVDTKIEVRLRDALAGVDRSSIVVGVAGTTQMTRIKNAPPAYRLRFQPAAPFLDNQRVEVRIDAADLATPPNVMPTDIYTFTIVRDSLPPFASNHRPAKGATNVPLDADIRIEIRDDLSGVDRNALSMEVNGQAVQPTITSISPGFALQLKPVLRYNAAVLVITRARDLAQPANVMPPDTLRFSTIRDVAPPFATDHLPAKGAANAPANINISLHVRDLIAGVDRASLAMKVNGALVGPVITGSSQDYQLEYNPPSDFALGDTVRVSIAAQDLSSPPNAMPAESYLFIIQSLQEDFPDLAVTQLEPAGTFFVGTQGTVIGEIANVGEVSAGESFNVQFRVDGGVQKDTTFSQLAANASVTLRLPIRFQTTGTHEVELEIDVGKKIREVTEANNSQKLVVQISQSPALSNRLTARPNPFTPNDDGFNDQIEFDYSGLGLRNPSLQIFDANGIAVWSNHSGAGGRFMWNGRDDRGRDVTPGVYLYSLRDQGNNVASGYVVVAR